MKKLYRRSGNFFLVCANREEKNMKIYFTIDDQYILVHTVSQHSLLVILCETASSSILAGDSIMANTRQLSA